MFKSESRLINLPQMALAKTNKKYTKGEKTKLLLQETALKLLVRDGFHGMKISELCKEAGIASGTFYIYFKDKTELAIHVVKERLSENEKFIFDGAHHDDPYDAIYEANARYIQTFVKAGALNKVLVQMMDEIPEMQEYWQKSLARISKRIAEGIAGKYEDATHEKDRLFVAFAAQAMADGLALQYFAWSQSEVVESAGTVEELTEKISVMWHRLLYGCNPPEAKLKHPSILELTL